MIPLEHWNAGKFVQFSGKSGREGWFIISVAPPIGLLAHCVSAMFQDVWNTFQREHRAGPRPVLELRMID